MCSALDTPSVYVCGVHVFVKECVASKPQSTSYMQTHKHIAIEAKKEWGIPKWSENEMAWDRKSWNVAKSNCELNKCEMLTVINEIINRLSPVHIIKIKRFVLFGWCLLFVVVVAPTIFCYVCDIHLCTHLGTTIASHIWCQLMCNEHIFSVFRFDTWRFVLQVWVGFFFCFTHSIFMINLIYLISCIVLKKKTTLITTAITSQQRLNLHNF